MNSKQVKGLAVVSIADGAKPGTVDRISVDPSGRRVPSLGGDVVVVADDVVAESAPVAVDPA